MPRMATGRQVFSGEKPKRPLQDEPLVSIITVCLNAERTIRDTIESVLNQTYNPIEYVIVDGGSTDRTLSIIGEYRNKIDLLISEKDDGISQAFNKGVERSKGDIVEILNADDWLDTSAVSAAVSALQSDPRAAFVFGDQALLEGREAELEYMPGDSAYTSKLRYTMPRLNHPTIFVRREMFQTYGVYDTRYRIAMDYDWILRLHLGGERGNYSSGIRAYKRKGGLSGRRRFDTFRECRDISISHGLNPVLAYSYFGLRCLKHVLSVLVGVR